MQRWTSSLPHTSGASAAAGQDDLRVRVRGMHLADGAIGQPVSTSDASGRSTCVPPEPGGKLNLELQAGVLRDTMKIDP